MDADEDEDKDDVGDEYIGGDDDTTVVGGIDKNSFADMISLLVVVDADNPLSEWHSIDRIL